MEGKYGVQMLKCSTEQLLTEGPPIVRSQYLLDLPSHAVRVQKETPSTSCSAAGHHMCDAISTAAHLRYARVAGTD